LLQADRNTVYRVNRRFRWYLKIPRCGTPDPDRREYRGAEAVRATLADHAGYEHPAVVRVSLDRPYVLCSAVPGRPLNLALYAACLLPIVGKARPTREAFVDFGETLGRLHQFPIDSQTPPVNKNAAADLDALIGKVTEPDPTAKAIISWREINPADNAQPTFLHGNLKMENVLVRNTRVCFLDFENSGYGPIYEDLSWVCSQIVLTRALAAFPWRRGFRAIGGFLEGYRRNRQYRSEMLLRYVAMRVCHYYIDVCLMQSGRPRIAGIPVRKQQLRRVLAGLLQGELTAVFPGIKF